MERDDIVRWIAAYEALWRERRPRDLGELFTADAVYRTSPGAEPIRGLAAIREWWEAESDPAERWELAAEVVAVEGYVAVARLDVRYTAPTELRYLDLWVMRFASGGRCSEFEEWYWTPSASAQDAPSR